MSKTEKNVENLEKSTNDSFEEVKKTINKVGDFFVKIRRNISFFCLKIIKHKKYLFVTVLSITMLFVVIKIINISLLNIYYNKIPSLYENELKVEGDIEMIMYFDNSNIDMQTAENLKSGNIFRGLYVNSNLYEYDDSHSDYENDPFSLEGLEYKGDNGGFGGYISYEVEDKYIIDELELQKEYDKLLNKGIEVFHKKVDSSHIFYGGAIEQGKSVYEYRTFKLLNENVNKKTFLAIGLERNTKIYNRTLEGLMGIYSDGFTSLGLNTFFTKNIIDYLNINGIIEKTLNVVNDKLIFDNIYYVFSKSEGNMEVDIIIEGEELKLLKSISKIICSKLKTDYFENRENKNFGFKGYSCDTKFKDHKLKIKLVYDDIKNHLQKLRK